MKKIILCLLVFLTFSLVGCNDDVEVTTKMKVHFIIGDDKVYTLEFNEDFMLPYAPQKSGYTFDDWYIDKNYEINATYENILDSFVEDELNVYGKYNANIYDYQINFIANNKIFETVEFKSNTSVVMPTAPSDSRYEEFDGWYFDNEFNEVLNYVTLDEKIKESHSINLYAKFKEVNKYVDIYYYTNDKYQYAAYNTANEYIAPEDPTLSDGLEFLGWFIDEEKTIKFDDSKIKEYTKESTSLKLYAKIDEEKKYTINFALDETKTISWYASSSIPEFPVASKENHKFSGWMYNNNVITNDIYSYFNEQNEITLFPKFELLDLNYVVIVGFETLQFYEDENIVLPSLVKENFVFKGFYLDAEFINEYDSEYDYFSNDDTLTIYPKFEEIEKMVIKFDTGTSTLIDDLTIHNNNEVLTEITLPSTTSLYREFLGWTYNGNLIDENDLYEMYSEGFEITLIAKYKAIDYTFNYYLNDNLLKTTSWTYPNEMFELITIDKEHYVFLGWYCDGIKVTNENIVTFMKEDSELNLYAKLQTITYKFDFDFDGPDFIPTYYWNIEQEFKLPIPVAPHYTFIQWEDINGVVFNEDTILNNLDDRISYLLLGIYTEADFYELTYLLKDDVEVVKWYKTEEQPLLLNSDNDLFFNYFYNNYIVTNENLLSFFVEDELTIKAVYTNDLTDSILVYLEEQLNVWISNNLENELVEFLLDKSNDIFNNLFTQSELEEAYLKSLETITKYVKENLETTYYNNTVDFIENLTEEDLLNYYLDGEMWLKQELGILNDYITQIYEEVMFELENNDEIAITLLTYLFDFVIDNYSTELNLYLPQILEVSLKHFDDETVLTSLTEVIKFLIETENTKTLNLLIDTLFNYAVETNDSELTINIFILFNNTLPSDVTYELFQTYLTIYLENVDYNNIELELIFAIANNLLTEEQMFELVKTIIITLSKNVDNTTLANVIVAIVEQLFVINPNIAVDLLVWSISNLDIEIIMKFITPLTNLISNLEQEQKDQINNALKEKFGFWIPIQF